MSTPFSVIFEAFLDQITDDYYTTVTQDIAEQDMTSLLRSAIFQFKYPRIDISDRDDAAKIFNVSLTDAEVQVLAALMKQQWVRRRIDDIENIRQKYSERDFQLTSQAAHLKTLIELRKEVATEAKAALDVYSKVQNFKPSPIFGELASPPTVKATSGEEGATQESGE